MIGSALSTRGMTWPLQATLGALILCGFGPQVIEMEGALPLSLQSLLVCWIPLMTGWRSGLTAILLYLAAGALGLPVFAANRAGLEVIAGPTGGYLLGFPIVAFLLGIIGNWAEDLAIRTRYGVVAIAMLLGHALILALGIPWQMQFDPDLNPALLLERLARPVALKSAVGLLLSVVAIRSVQRRA